MVAIIGILTAIAYPTYQGQVTKSRRAEGRALLLEVAQALEKCKTLYGAYNNANCATRNAITGGTISSAEGFYLASATAAPTATTFTLRAVPQQPDPLCETLTLDQAGLQGEGGTGTVDACW